MAIDFFTGFEGCSNAQDVKNLFDYASGSTSYWYNATNGYNGSKCAEMVEYGDCYSRIDLDTPRKTVVVGEHIKQAYAGSFLLSLPHSVFSFGLTNGDYIYLMNRADFLKVYYNSSEIAACSTNIPFGMSHIEVKLFSDSSSGTAQVKLNGNLILNASGLNTGGDDISKVYFGCSNDTSSNRTYLDNMFIADDWQGELVSQLILPTSDVAVAFTPSTGTDNYAMVDEIGDDADSTYVTAEAIDTTDLYGYSDVTDDGSISVKAVSIVTVARKSDGTSRYLQNMARQDSTDYPLTSKALTPEYPLFGELLIETLNTAPDGTSWTPSKLNSIAFGFKVSA